MNKTKLEKYNLTASIHTVTIRSEDEPVTPVNADLEAMRPAYLPITKQWATRINLNKLGGDIFSYGEFRAAMYELTRHLQLPDYTYYRTDIRLDSYDDNFKEYYKINLLLINLFSILFHDPNGQAVSHQLTCSKTFTDISTKNQYWEVKYYDKKYQTNDADPAKARLEFRNLKTTAKDGYAPHEIKEKWFEKLDKLPSLYDELQQQCNMELYGAYRAYCNYNSKGQKKSDCATGFLSNYSNSMTIFTRKQLREFLQMCGLSETIAASRAENIIDRVHIEFFSKSDIERYISKIKCSMDDFFEC